MGTNTVEFSFRPEGDRTTMTWSMAGERNFTVKALGLIVSMDRMVGGDFEKGLAQMKAVVEAVPRRWGGDVHQAERRGTRS